MQTFIYPIHGEYIEEIMSVIYDHPEWYGKVDVEHMIHPHMYILVDAQGKLVAFFGIASWVDEDVICFVYVKEEYRKQGIFNKMVKFVKQKCYTKSITIGACKENKLANEIYSKKFQLLGLGDDGYHYLVVDRRKNK